MPKDDKKEFYRALNVDGYSSESMCIARDREFCCELLNKLRYKLTTEVWVLADCDASCCLIGH